MIDGDPFKLMSERLPYRWVEREQRELASEMLRGPLHLAGEASEVLARTLVPLSSPASTEAVSMSEFWKKTALVHILTMAVRSGRASVNLIEMGYAPEAMLPLRLLVESVNGAKWILEDPDGNRARDWLVDERKGRSSASRIAGRVGADNSFDLLSKRAHMTNTAAAAFRDDPDEHNRISVRAAPSHDLRTSASMLFAISEMFAELARLAANAWDVDPDDGLEGVQLVLEVDKPRHTPLVELLESRATNPHGVGKAPTGAFV